MSLPPRKAYSGESRRLLLAFDIGTTFSGISYSILDPGNVPEVLPVTCYPCQEHVGGDSKIPTVIYYDTKGDVCAIGAETLKDGIEEEAEENGWTKARWFKLHFRPKPDPTSLHSIFRRLGLMFPGDSNDQNDPNLDPTPPLPSGKTVVQLFSDYMAYLLQCAKKYISDTHGVNVWSSLEGDIMYVLTHPNGWGGLQQAQMRKAAITAGLIPDTDVGRSRVTFVTEGEASLHFCLSNGLTIQGDSQSGVLIVDAGGGTIDLTAYRKLPDHSYEEVSIPKCYFQGSAYVTMRAQQHFENLLSKTRFSRDVEALTTRFDRKTKHVFRRDDETLHVQFASYRERDDDLNIRGGRLALPGRDVAEFFEPSISCIVQAIKDQNSTSLVPIKTVFLVGGFSASSWLLENVRKQIEPLGFAVTRPDTHVNKAVSNGAVSFYLDGVVSARVARTTYGTQVSTEYDSTNPSHRQFCHLVGTHGVSGKPVIPGIFSPILSKGTRVKETTEFRKTYSAQDFQRQDLNVKTVLISSYSGDTTGSVWMGDQLGMFSNVCTVEADTSAVKTELRRSTTGARYHVLGFDIVLQFGLTELKAQIAYQEGGVEKRGPATVIYEE